MTETHSAISPHKLRGQVLQQVYRIWLFRKLLPVLFLEITILVVVLYGLGRMVFIQRIIENALEVFFLNPPQILSFLLSMFVKAPILAQLLGFSVIILIALVVRHLTQGMLRFVLVKQNFFGKADRDNS